MCASPDWACTYYPSAGIDPDLLDRAGLDDLPASTTWRSPETRSPETRSPETRSPETRPNKTRRGTAIADQLSLSEHSVEKHTSGIFAKLDLTSDRHANRRVKAVLLYLAGRAAA